MQFVVVCSLFILGLAVLSRAESEFQNVENLSKMEVLTRNVRSTLSSVRSEYASELEDKIIANCKSNGFTNATEELKPTFNEMIECLRKKRLFLTPREEFLENFKECSRDSIRKTKNCLKENQQYFPDLILTQAESIINFFYDDYDIIRVDLVSCLPKLNSLEALNSQKQCIHQATANQHHENHHIPPSKEEFCQKFVPTSYCFTTMIKQHCDETPGLAKYRKDYIKAHKAACEENVTT